MHKKAFTALKYIKHVLILDCTVTGCVLISAFLSLAGIPVDIVNFAVGIKMFAITFGNKWYRSITKKKKKQHGKIVLLANPKLNSLEVLFSKALIKSSLDSCLLC